VLHGGLNDQEREQARREFVGDPAQGIAPVSNVLVASDLLARGVDIPTVGLVVNFDLPRAPFKQDVADTETYAHRIARTARAGRVGSVLNLISDSVERKILEQIATHFCIPIFDLATTKEGGFDTNQVSISEWSPGDIEGMAEQIVQREEEIRKRVGAKQTKEVTVSTADGAQLSQHLQCELEFTDETLGIDNFAALPALEKENLEKIRSGILTELRIERAFPIQAQTIPVMLNPNLQANLIAQAQGGSGKTLAFAVGMLARVDATKAQCQALCIAPTTVLAHQTQDQYISRLAPAMGITSKVMVSGYRSNRGEKFSNQVCIGTPGTVENQIKYRHLDVSACRVFVVDEADLVSAVTD
jgi:superfamily II DNA/RNA helicase